ncbi:MAG TPA: sigma-70 family RNA polymerase sigma factor [Rhizomicrobium sp.]|jgi:RNA polymerase sigma-70 factor (ECF subfamily)|nr:sigma-70 family RNA polymerase sigma factor [Rhizomicrobium sp.]
MEKAPCAARQPEPLALADLILRGRSGDRQALKLLIEHYQLRMARFVIGETRDGNAFEDLCQAIFVKMVLGLPRLRDPARFEPWLYQIARNVCRDHLRAVLGWRRYFVSYEPAHDSVAVAEFEPTENDLEQAIASLAPKDRTLLRRLMNEKKTQQELARDSNTSVAAIKSRLYRARRELRALIAAGDSK